MNVYKVRIEPTMYLVTYLIAARSIEDAVRKGQKKAKSDGFVGVTVTSVECLGPLDGKQ